MRLLRASVAILAASAALVGCGAEEDAARVPTGPEAAAEGVDAYLEQVRGADGTLRASADRLAAGTTAGELEQVLTDLEDAVRRVEQATPPYDLLPEHQQLTQSMWIAVDEGHGLAVEGEVGARDLAPVVEALDDAAAALDGMEDKGYDVRRRT